MSVLSDRKDTHTSVPLTQVMLITRTYHMENRVLILRRKVGGTNDKLLKCEKVTFKCMTSLVLFNKS